MAGKGKKFTFFGMFKTKKAAKRKEHEGRGRFILPERIHGMRRYLVLKPK